jgi:AcrR family transcriptional regulator
MSTMTETQGDPQLTRRERRKLEVRNRILGAAVELFDRKGVAGTTVAAICEKADIAHKTFFNHFPAKQELLREIASVHINKLLENLEETRKRPGTTRERIHFFFELVADNSEAAGPMHRELITEVVHVAHEAGAEPEQARQLHAAFGAIINEGITLGDITNEHDPGTLTDMLMGAFYALMFNWANLDHYPIRKHALASARFLADSMSVTPPSFIRERTR